MQHKQGALKLWFDFLQLAIRNGVPINEAYYARWGTKSEIAGATFHRWWRERGKELLAVSTPMREQQIKVVSQDEGSVTVCIPTDLPMAIINRGVGKIVTGARNSKQTRAFASFAPSGQVNYKNLAAYKRYLEIELDPRNAKRSGAEKIALLQQAYGKIHERMKKQRNTMRAKGNKEAAARFSSHEPDVFDTTDKSSRLKLAGFSPKKAHRWKVSGQLVMLNVAEGRFPGEGYYGARIAESLRRRKQKMNVNF